MDIRTLEHVDLETLTDIFNRAFADYMVEIRLTPEQMAEKVRVENIRFDISGGAFDDDRLIGFILMADGMEDGKKTAYNAGTGVVPQRRGRNITRSIYNYLLPLLKAREYQQSTLEVITTNTPAVRIYTNMGYEIARELDCLFGRVNISNAKLAIEISESNLSEIGGFEKYWDWQPTWQNSTSAILRYGNMIKIITATINNIPVAYAIYHPLKSRVHQFAVKDEYRRHGIGTAMFSFMQRQCSNDLGVINADKRSAQTLKFLKSIGLQSHLAQYEMILQF